MPTIEFLMGESVATAHVETQQSILEQALSQGMAISYACKRGDCGQCVGSLLTGTVEPFDFNKPCMRDREVYLCNARAISDLVVRLPYSPETAHVKVLRSPCKIHELKYLSDDVLEVSLRLPPTVEFAYVPGQYIRLTNKERNTRSYSLAEDPSSSKLLRIHVRRVEQGAFSRYLFSVAQVGDLLHLEGPLGRFVFPENRSVSKTIFLATGTGIAPIYAILSSLTAEQRERCGELHLYWGNRFQKDAYFHPQLVVLAHRLDLQYFAVFSREEGGQPFVDTHHIQDLMAKRCSNLQDAQAFASGNAAMVDEARKLCLSLGLQPERFLADPFTSS
jgi:CDP-4-dehydro-6-deoxyglucose reductase, E3